MRGIVEYPRSGEEPCLQRVMRTLCSRPPTLLVSAPGPHLLLCRRAPSGPILLVVKGRGCCGGNGGVSKASLLTTLSLWNSPDQVFSSLAILSLPGPQFTCSNRRGLGVDISRHFQCQGSASRWRTGEPPAFSLDVGRGLSWLCRGYCFPLLLSWASIPRPSLEQVSGGMRPHPALQAPDRGQPLPGGAGSFLVQISGSQV